MESLNGKWIGKFTFDEQKTSYEEMDHHFEMSIEVDDDDVTGEIKDIGEDNDSLGRATIEGFIDGDEISFIKQYPSLHYKNELNETIVDSSKPHPEIHYHGVIQNGIIKGTWEMEAGVVFRAGQYLADMVNGTWEISKSEE